MDWKKDITLGDLVPKSFTLRRPRRGGGGQPDAAPRELVGLKIGATGLTAAHVRTNGRPELLRLAHAPLPPGVIDSGEVRDPLALQEALEALFAQNELPRKGVRIGLANSRIGVRTIEIAGIEDERQLGNAISFRAHEMLSVPVEEAVIDYHVLSTDVDETGATTRKILLVVAYRDSVDRYVTACDQAGLELTGIDLEAFALLRAVAEPRDDGTEPEAAVIAVSIGHERTTLAISDGRVCQFARVLEWGGAEIGLAVARALKLSPSEGDEIKRVLSLAPGAPPPPSLDVVQAAEALEAARFELQTLVRELVSSLRFYQSQEGSLAIGEIIVAGGTAQLDGIGEELERELGIRVRLADPLLRVGLGEGVTRPETPLPLAVAVGLAIQD